MPSIFWHTETAAFIVRGCLCNTVAAKALGMLGKRVVLVPSCLVRLQDAIAFLAAAGGRFAVVCEVMPNVKASVTCAVTVQYGHPISFVDRLIESHRGEYKVFTGSRVLPADHSFAEDVS